MSHTPYSHEAEMSVLSCILSGDDQKLNELIELGVTEEHFYSKENQSIFNAAYNLYERGIAVDTVTVADELKRLKALDDIGGMPYVAGVLNYSGHNAKSHVRLLEQKKLARRLLKVSQKISESVYEGAKDVDDLLDEAESAVLEVGSDRVATNFRPMKDVLIEEMGAIQERMQPGWQPDAVSTGISSLDYRLVGGFHADHLILIAGRPSMGKSALALNIAANAAIRQGLNVAFFSLEMSESELIQRVLSFEAQVELRNIRTGDITAIEKDRLSQAARNVKDSPLYIDENPMVSPLGIKSKVRRLHSQVGVDLVMIDYLQLMAADRPTGNRVVDVSEMSRSMKVLARELHIPVVALSQLSRKCEDREDKRPLPSDLRDSGSLEQDADEILFVFRPEVYAQYDERGQPNEGKAEINVAKQRNGETGILTLKYDKKFTRFR